MRAFVTPGASRVKPILYRGPQSGRRLCRARGHPHRPQVTHAARRASRPHWSLCTDSSSSPSLAHRLASAFIDACQPGRKPYATALRDFCDTALAAYREGYSLQALQVELSTSGGSARALRALQQDEAELREVWLSLVYKTLGRLGYPGPRRVESEAEDRLDEFVGNIVNAVKAGYDMQRIQLEQSLSQKEKPRTRLESAILGQSTRLVVTTISAAADDLKGRQGGRGGEPAT